MGRAAVLIKSSSHTDFLIEEQKQMINASFISTLCNQLYVTFQSALGSSEEQEIEILHINEWVLLSQGYTSPKCELKHHMKIFSHLQICGVIQKE